MMTMHISLFIKLNAVLDFSAMTVKSSKLQQFFSFFFLNLPFIPHIFNKNMINSIIKFRQKLAKVDLFIKENTGIRIP